MPKKSLRKQLLLQRRDMLFDHWQAASHAAQQQLIALEQFQRADCIALYAPIQHEVDTMLLFCTARATGKQVLYPQVCGDELRFRPVEQLEQLSIGGFGILEPCLSLPAITLNQAELIVVPGVAFDLQGHRIGFGKGFYDRALHRISSHTTLVGLCHDFQVVEQIPAEGHDIRMQYIITDRRTITIPGY